MSSLGLSKDKDDTIVVIVGGVKHQMAKTTLMTHPGSRLARLIDTETPPTEVCFDRHPDVFAHVLQYYRSGKLHCPTNLCGVLLEEELAFWGISISDVEPCCWAAFHQNSEAAEALESTEKKSDQTNQSSKLWQSKLWALFDEPHSSILAMVIAVTSLFFILLSITAFSLETNRSINPLLYHSYPRNTSAGEDFSGSNSGVLDGIELVCSLWFFVEFVTRVVSCPSKCGFFMNVLNIVDLLALFPWFFRWCPGYHCIWLLGFLRVMRCLRFLRVFKLMQHVLGVRVLFYTLRASAPALCSVPLALFSCTIIFGVMIYYAELHADYNDTFLDIPSSFWWAVVTLTTVGYGDMLPRTVQGQFVGALCAVVGVFVIILPVPIIVNNFITFYSHAKAKDSMPRKSVKSDVEMNP